ncbi:hypothetical protein BDZ88DRAFT_442544, partial [Geranomyces variabilis]
RLLDYVDQTVQGRTAGYIAEYGPLAERACKAFMEKDMDVWTAWEEDYDALGEREGSFESDEEAPAAPAPEQLAIIPQVECIRNAHKGFWTIHGRVAQEKGPKTLSSSMQAITTMLSRIHHEVLGITQEQKEVGTMGAPLASHRSLHREISTWLVRSKVVSTLSALTNCLTIVLAIRCARAHRLRLSSEAQLFPMNGKSYNCASQAVPSPDKETETQPSGRHILQRATEPAPGSCKSGSKSTPLLLLYSLQLGPAVMGASWSRNRTHQALRQTDCNRPIKLGGAKEAASGDSRSASNLSPRPSSPRVHTGQNLLDRSAGAATCTHLHWCKTRRDRTLNGYDNEHIALCIDREDPEHAARLTV